MSIRDMKFYQFCVDGRAAGPMRVKWGDAAQDAVDGGMAVWSGDNQITLADHLGATIQRHDPRNPRDRQPQPTKPE